MNTPITINFSLPEAVQPEKRHLAARSGMSTLWWAMRQGILAARESRNTLPWLAPEKARELFDRWLRGEYAQVQWAWELMEKYDETLFAVKRARLSALQDMPWQVVIDADAVGEDAARQQLAEAQKQHLNTLLGNVENLRASLRHLGTADFRGYAVLEVCGTDERMRWEIIEPWLLVRPNLAGPFMYNEKAEDTPSRPELLDTERVLLREAEPIDLPAMFLLTAKHHGTKAWDAFLDTFGIPSIFLETPPNTTEEQALEYQQKVEDIVGEGRGTIPNGAKFHTVETGQKETKSFQDRADWCKNALLILATGGLLTITAESGSGTLAGNAHADSFERLCNASAQDISEVVDFQFCRRKLKERFPGQPILAHFELAPEQPDDRAAQAQILATLAGAGFKPSAEVVSEMMGFEVTEAQPPQMPGMPMLNTAASSIITNSAGAPPAKDPLSEAEMNALQSLASGKLSAEGLQGASNAMAGALQSAITNSESEDCRAKDPEHCRVHGEQSEAEDAALARSSMEGAGHSKEIARVIGKEPRQRLTSEQASEAREFMKQSTAIKKQIKERLPEHGGLKLDMLEESVRGAVMTRKAVGEMLSRKAIHASLSNGCPVAAHVEAVERASEIAPRAKKVGEQPGMKEGDKTAKITHLETEFTAADKKNYIAHYTVHHPKDKKEPPRLYFMYLRK